MKRCDCPDCETDAFIAWLERVHPRIGATSQDLHDRFHDVIWPIMLEADH